MDPRVIKGLYEWCKATQYVLYAGLCHVMHDSEDGPFLVHTFNLN